MEYYSAIKTEVLIFEPIWKNLKKFMSKFVKEARYKINLYDAICGEFKNRQNQSVVAESKKPTVSVE